MCGEATIPYRGGSKNVITRVGTLYYAVKHLTLYLKSAPVFYPYRNPAFEFRITKALLTTKEKLLIQINACPCLRAGCRAILYFKILHGWFIHLSNIKKYLIPTISVTVDYV